MAGNIWCFLCSLEHGCHKVLFNVILYCSCQQCSPSTWELVMLTSQNCELVKQIYDISKNSTGSIFRCLFTSVLNVVVMYPVHHLHLVLKIAHTLSINGNKMFYFQNSRVAFQHNKIVFIPRGVVLHSLLISKNSNIACADAAFANVKQTSKSIFTVKSHFPKLNFQVPKILIGVSLSEPHTSVTALHRCVYSCLCPVIYCKF